MVSKKVFYASKTKSKPSSQKARLLHTKLQGDGFGPQNTSQKKHLPAPKPPAPPVEDVDECISESSSSGEGPELDVSQELTGAVSRPRAASAPPRPSQEARERWFFAGLVGFC